MFSTELNDVGLEAKVSALISKSKESSVSNADLAQLLELLQELDKRQEFSGFHKRFVPNTPYSIDNLPKHAACMAALGPYREVLLLGGNRSGKTDLGAYICAVLATGQYPEWWGDDWLRFEGPVEIWACGKTGQTTRDTVQRALLGAPGALGTGMIPLDCIGKRVALSGTPNAVDQVSVLHTSGKWSTIGFKSYKQEAPGFFGTARHLVWLDEPAPEDIYNECLIRTAKLDHDPVSGPEGGRILHTITPKEGLTRLLADFLANCDLLAGMDRIEGIEKASAMMEMEANSFYKDEHDKPKAPQRMHRAAVSITWDDIPWMSDDTKREILESTPMHLRDTVSRGVPSIGDGAVYPFPLADLLLKPSEVFPIPAHYRKIYGMDVGWKCTAAVFGAIDPDTDVLYIYAEHYVSHQPPEVHAARIKSVAGDWMVGAIDPASKKPMQDGKVMLQDYRRMGLKLVEADNAVESGIAKVTSLMAQGKIKFFPHTTKFLQNEYLTYSREDGKIKKKDDHALDALRYLVSKMQHAKATPTTGQLIPGIRNYSAPKRRYNV